MSFKRHYYTDAAYFIAGGKTLEIIKKFEDDAKNHMEILHAIASEFGEVEFVYSSSVPFVYKNEVSHPALKFVKESQGYAYMPNPDSAEGLALEARLSDVPRWEMNYEVFAKRLTGESFIDTNPDKLNLREELFLSRDYYNNERKVTAAKFNKIGDVYVVSVPRTIAGIFNKASHDHITRGAYRIADGYEYKWFTPPDSKPVSYSYVIGLYEMQMGSQIKEKKITQQITAPNLK